MAVSINWIHVSDLHFGLDRNSWLWPNMKHRVLENLDATVSRIGKLDLVFFTGDLVQSGSPQEFDLLNRELEEFWQVLGKHGASPRLCVVPGNHDLSRPPIDSPISKTLTQLWSSDQHLQRQFWSSNDSEYRNAIVQFFAPYTNWLRDVSVPTLSINSGILPGDFSATYEKGEVKLAVIGLNSTFLQIADGDFQRKLDLHVSQLNAVCNGDPERWLSTRTAAVLLTHQPPSWLSTDAFDHYRQEIYPSGRFIAHLCGHQHEPESFETSEAGAPPRRLRQAPSLFGLDSWRGVHPKKRTHGYNAGQFVFQTSDGLEKVWPKIAVKGRDGALNLAPDHSYKLKDDCVATPFEIKSAAEHVEHPQLASAIAAGKPGELHLTHQDISLLDSEPTEETARTRLVSCPRLVLSAGPHYRATRQDEQSQFEHELRKARRVWLVADWGTGQEGFLSAALERLNDLNASHDIFHLRCDEATDINSLESLFPQQFAYPVQTFCRFVGGLPAAFLILDAIHPALCTGESLTALQRFADAIAEYCPQLRLVITSGSLPENPDCPTIQLSPLDVPEVRTYLTHHPDATPEIRDPDIIEQLHERAEGLPMHIDRLIKAMRVASPTSVLEADREESITPAGGVDQSTPQALVYAVNTLVGSADLRSNRSLQLLKVLSLLPYGETLEALHHFLPTQPFFPESALQLEELTLLDIIPLHQTTPRLGTAELQGAGPAAAPKLLKVPRPVRDYVVALLTDGEKDEIVRAGIEKFFGRGWRYGKVRLRRVPPEYREYLSTGAGNEFALLHQLIVMSRARGENAVVTRAAALALQYCRHLVNSQRFHDLEVVAGALLQLIDQERHPKEWTELAGLYGAGLRMIGKKEESLTYLRAALESGEMQFNDAEKASIWMDVALAEHKRNNIDDAVAAAKHVQAYSKNERALHVQASGLIAQLTLSGPAKIDALTALEKEARSDGNIGAATGILLDLYSATSDPNEELRYIDKILKTEKEGYQRIRAIVAKAQILGRLKKEPDLTPAELMDLAKGYTYLHTQRFGALFDQCHSVLWDALELRGDMQRLLRLFRHSSFLWRLRGREEQESNYLKRLSLKKVQAETPHGKTVVIEFIYFKQRLKVMFSPSQQAIESSVHTSDSATSGSASKIASKPQ